MNDTVKTSSGLGEGERIYSVDAGTRRQNWFLMGGSAASALGVACFGIFGTSSNDIQIMTGLLAIAFLAFALYSARYNQLATFLYPDRIVSRGLFTQASLRRDDIAGYELIPERSGPPTLKLIPKDPTHKGLRVNRFSPDDTFRKWLSDVPDLRLTPSVLRRKRRFNAVLAGIFSIGWCALLLLGARQTIQQYDQFIVLKSRGIAVEGYVRSKSISGRHHAHYIAYTFTVKSKSRSMVLGNEVEVAAGDYQSVSVGDTLPVVYDPANDKISYPNLNGSLGRINPQAYLRHNLVLFALATLLVVVVMGCAYVLQNRVDRRPLPLGELA